MTTTSPSSAPTADWVDPVAMAADPFDTYERLRALGPVVYVPVLERYLALSFEACRAIEADQQTYSASISGSGATMARALGDQPMLRKDDPAHALERRPVNSTLRPKNIREHWVPLFERNARTYLAALVERGPAEADLDRDFAIPLAAQNLIDMLGLRGAGPADMRRWSHAFIAGCANLADDPATWERCDTAQQELDTLLDDLIVAFRRNPDGSMTSAWATSGLPDVAIRSNVKLTIAGGLNEPQHVITNLVWALSAHPDQRHRVLADPSLWLTAFEETIRWLPPIGMYPRQTTRETILDGVALPAGATLGVVVAAANRDPSAFERPEAFDIGRPKRPHLSFGSGVHLCAGHWAARIAVGEIAIPLLYEQLPGLRTDPSRPAAWDGWVFRGLTSLPVTWDG